MRLATFGILFLSGSVFAAPIPKEAKRNDLRRMEGLWWEYRFNNTVTSNLEASRQFSFQRDGTAGILQNAGATPIPFKFELDTLEYPSRFTWKQVGGGGDYIAIYRMEADMLYIVFTDCKKAQPNEVKPGVGDVYYELKKVK